MTNQPRIRIALPSIFRSSFVGVFATGCLLVGMWPVNLAPAGVTGIWTEQPSPKTGGDITVHDWSRDAWRVALGGDEADLVGQWASIPEDHEHYGVRRLRGTLDRYFDHLNTQADDRVEQYQESRRELEEHLDQNELRDALASALAMHELGLEEGEMLMVFETDELPRQAQTLADPMVQDLIRRAEVEADRAEADGRWLDAQDYYYRLNVLLERQYDAPLKRVSNRIGLLRFYNPSRLHKLLNDRRVRMGEDVLPEYEAREDTWHSRLAEGSRKISRSMAIDGLSLAARNHLWQRGWSPLMVGGYDALEIFITTPDLAEVFPGLADENAREEFLRHIRTDRAAWVEEENGRRMTASTVLRQAQAANKRTINLPEEVLVYTFTEGAIDTLDRFSDFVWPYELEQFSRQLNGAFTGVGVQIVLDDAGMLKIVTPLEGSPGHYAGLRAQDRIVAINDHATLGISLNQAVKEITGAEGSWVKLTVQREGEDGPIDFDIRRERIKIESVKGWRRRVDRQWDYIIDPDYNIGYIRLTGFFKQSPIDFDRAIDEMIEIQGARAVVLDLRFNPGGHLGATIDLCNQFISNGVLVSTKGPRPGDTQRNIARTSRINRNLRDVPVVVLINQGSASASEILSGCLRDHDRAVVIGTRSYGKGSVQKVLSQVAGGRANLRLTTEHYMLPDGDLIHRERDSKEWGVEPDLVVRMTPEQISESISLLRAADVIHDPSEQVTEEERANRDPRRLFTDSVDLQLETALIVLQSRLVEDEAGAARLTLTP